MCMSVCLGVHNYWCVCLCRVDVAALGIYIYIFLDMNFETSCIFHQMRNQRATVIHVSQYSVYVVRCIYTYKHTYKHFHT